MDDVQVAWGNVIEEMVNLNRVVRHGKISVSWNDQYKVREISGPP